MKHTNHSQESFSRYIFGGYVVSVLITVVVVGGTHLLLQLNWVQMTLLALTSLLLAGGIVTRVLSKSLREPIEHITKELNELNEKVNASNSALSAVSENTKTLLEDLPVGFLIFDNNDELTKVNQLAAKMLGFNEEDQINTQTTLQRLSQLRSNGGGVVNFLDWLHQAKSQKIQDLKRWPMVIFQHGEETMAYDILVHYNKNDTYNYEVVALLIDRSEEYNRQEKQMEFISLAAHELRGPITVMRGIIDIFQDEVGATLDAEHKELLTRMAISARQLAGYVDNILNVSRVDKDTFEIHQKEANWGSILTQSANDLSIRAKAHHRVIELHIAKNLPTIAVDPIAIQHVIQNLIDNAIKYSKDGGKIVVSAKLKEDTIETTIQDFGIGIPGNVVSNLFTKFYRSHRSKQIVSGTGLGLYLCKVIVDTHGGSIWVRSTEGVGTTFGFAIPTYASVADQLKNGVNSEDNGIIRGSHGWIKNHALYRR